MSGGLMDKVYIGLDNAPAAFDIKGRILGPNGTNLDYIRSETGVVAILKSDKFEPLHLALHHTRSESLAAARSLALNLIETVRAELAQWSAAQAGGPPPALNVPPPTLSSTTAPPPVPPPGVSVSLSSGTAMTSVAQSGFAPVVSVAAGAPLMTVRQPTVLQLLPQQQQYVLNQENGQLIPIVQPGVQVQNTNFTSLPIAQSLGIQQPNFGTQMFDLSSMQPVNVTQLRLSGVPSSMSMILPNGLTIPHASLSNADTTVSSATNTPVVCAAQSTASHKILYSTDKGDKEVNTVQWAMPGSQTMLIPYQQLQDFASNQHGITNIQPQQFVSIAPAGSLPQTSLPLSAAQLQQLQAGTIMHLNQKPIVSSGSLINIISTGQASSPHIISSATKTIGHDSRGQKRLSDGTPTQLQLRPIAPAGSNSQEKSSTRESRSWTTSSAKDSTGMKINPAHGTIIHVSSGQQTNVSATSQEGTGMYIRQIDRNAIQIQSKDGKQELTTNKVQSSAQNVQMITVPQGMTVLQNPLNISQMPVIGQQNSQVYMIPANHPNIVQAGALQQGLLGQQVLQPGQNVTVMQPNQLGVPGGVQYNMPIMNMQQNSQYMSGIPLSTQLAAQQINAAIASQQMNNTNQNTIPIVQPLNNQSSSQVATPTQIPITQPPPPPPNTYNATAASQYTNMQQQYMMQQNAGTVPGNNQNVQYNAPTNQASSSANNSNGQSNTSDSDSNNGSSNQANFISSSSQDNNSYSNQNQAQPSFNSEGSSTQSTGFTGNTPVTQSSYGSSTNSQSQGYGSQASTNQQSSSEYNANGTSQTSQNYPNAQSASNGQNSSQNYSANQAYPNMQGMGYPPNQNPYPNATGQNLAAYANNQYQYQPRPWVRPRYSSPQGSPYSSGGGASNGPPMVPPPSGNYNYWQDN